MFLNNRYHDPTLGAFISVDPLVTFTGEAYLYGSANPITFSDPLGLCSANPAEREACERQAPPPPTPDTSTSPVPAGPPAPDTDQARCHATYANICVDAPISPRLSGGIDLENGTTRYVEVWEIYSASFSRGRSERTLWESYLTEAGSYRQFEHETFHDALFIASIRDTHQETTTPYAVAQVDYVLVDSTTDFLAWTPSVSAGGEGAPSYSLEKLRTTFVLSSDTTVFLGPGSFVDPTALGTPIAVISSFGKVFEGVQIP